MDGSVEMVDRPGAAWDKMTAGFADSSEFDWCDRPLSRIAAQAIGLAHEASSRSDLRRMLRKG